MGVDRLKCEEYKILFMVTKTKSKCKICRRLGMKLFLKGDKCYSQKCAMIKRAYPPGQPGKRRKMGASEYALQLREKQRLKNYYQLREKEFKNYIKEILERRGKVEDPSLLLIRKLEKRLDNVVYKAGFAFSRAQAKQLVSHSHFLVNNLPVNIPSYKVRKGQEVRVKEKSLKSPFFQNLKRILQNKKFPPWLEVDTEKMSAKIVGEPSLGDAPPVEISTIFEYYSR